MARTSKHPLPRQWRPSFEGQRHEDVFLGVDFATKASGTALTALHWPASGKPEIISVWCPIDHALLAEVLSADNVFAVAAVDVPFGWPSSFVEMVTDHASGHLEGRPRPADKRAATQWRTDEVALRETDRHVKNTYGIRPITVAFDKFGSTAAAWALVEADLPRDLDRTGGDANDRPRIVETYPAAQYRAWRSPDVPGPTKS